MAKVVAVGGVFFKSPDPAALGDWYARWLGLTVEPPHGASLSAGQMPPGGYHVWSPFPEDTAHVAPGDRT